MANQIIRNRKLQLANIVILTIYMVLSCWMLSSLLLPPFKLWGACALIVTGPYPITALWYFFKAKGENKFIKRACFINVGAHLILLLILVSGIIMFHKLENLALSSPQTVLFALFTWIFIAPQALIASLILFLIGISHKDEDSSDKNPLKSSENELLNIWGIPSFPNKTISMLESSLDVQKIAGTNLTLNPLRQVKNKKLQLVNLVILTIWMVIMALATRPFFIAVGIYWLLAIIYIFKNGEESKFINRACLVNVWSSIICLWCAIIWFLIVKDTGPIVATIAGIAMLMCLGISFILFLIGFFQKQKSEIKPSIASLVALDKK